MVKTARAVCEVERAKPSKTVLVTNYNYVIIANGRYVDKTREGRYAKE